MPTYEPGFFATRDPAPTWSPIASPGMFNPLLEPLVNVLGASDQILGAHQRTMANNLTAGLEGEFLGTIGEARQVLAANEHNGETLTAAALAGAGDGSEAIRVSVAGYLPGPDAPIPIDFTEPPRPPRAPDDDGGDGPPHRD